MNPWTNISWKNTIASCDQKYQVKINEKDVIFGSEEYVRYINRNDSKNAAQKKVELTFDFLPEPFSGDINSKVYCLNMNPGEPDCDFSSANDNSGVYEAQAKRILSQTIGSHPHVSHYFDDMLFDGQKIVCDKDAFQRCVSSDFYRIKKAFKSKESRGGINPRPHAGAVWQREIWNPMKKALYKNSISRDPNLFIVEYFPYHSSGGFVFPRDLPSYQYRNWLIEKAMEDRKLIIIMRQEKQWYDIPDNGLGNKIREYPNKILLRGSRRPWLSESNFCRDINVYTNPLPNWAYKTMKDVIVYF